MNQEQEKKPVVEGGGEGRAGVHPRNKLNNLTAKEWLQFTKSWFVSNPPPRKKNQVQHPAKFPEGIVQSFIEFFTKEGEIVLDPFVGVGSTLVAAARARRRGVGIEISPEFCAVARESCDCGAGGLTLIQGDAARAVELCRDRGIEAVDFIITSPPYWNMLGRSRGNVHSAHKERARQGLKVVYSQDPRDLGNIADYDEFLRALVGIFVDLKQLLRPRKYLVIVIQNVRVPTGEVKPLAWDLTRELARFYTFKGERLWLQDNKRLGIWGYPSEFVTNVHHHYCLVFKNGG